MYLLSCILVAPATRMQDSASYPCRLPNCNGRGLFLSAHCCVNHQLQNSCSVDVAGLGKHGTAVVCLKPMDFPWGRFGLPTLDSVESDLCGLAMRVSRFQRLLRTYLSKLASVWKQPVRFGNLLRGHVRCRPLAYRHHPGSVFQCFFPTPDLATGHQSGRTSQTGNFTRNSTNTYSFGLGESHRIFPRH